MHFGRCYIAYSSIVYNKLEISDYTHHAVQLHTQRSIPVSHDWYDTLTTSQRGAVRSFLNEDLSLPETLAAGIDEAKLFEYQRLKEAAEKAPATDLGPVANRNQRGML